MTFQSLHDEAACHLVRKRELGEPLRTPQKILTSQFMSVPQGAESAKLFYGFFILFFRNASRRHAACVRKVSEKFMSSSLTTFWDVEHVSSATAIMSSGFWFLFFTNASRQHAACVTKVSEKFKICDIFWLQSCLPNAPRTKKNILVDKVVLLYP